MTASDSRENLEADLTVHILTVSAAMVGVCLTVIGLLRIVITVRKADTFADDILAFNALLFLASCLSSYCALRKRGTRRMHRLERIADVLFMAAMLVMAFACLFITYAIAEH